MTYDVAAVDVLWRRDLKRFLRQPSRIAGALGQPLIFWLVIGSGLSATFAIPGESVGYMEFFFPGVVAMVLLFASIFASVSVIEDRRQGFLQAVLAGPASRGALVVGKCLGAATVALIQAGLFVALAPVAGFELTQINWPLLLAAMVITSVGLTAMGFAIAWWLDNVQAYHAIQMTMLVPLWVVSGAMFPPGETPSVFTTIMSFNPVAYSVSVIRHALYGGTAPEATVLTDQPWSELAVVALFGVVCLSFAVAMARRRR